MSVEENQSPTTTTTPPPEHQMLASREDILDAFTQLRDELRAIHEELAATREENRKLRTILDERLEERDKQLMQLIRQMQESAQAQIAAAKEEKKPWWKLLFT